ncbi:hypothetical protein [Tautonia marina]|uniref:hypothetical protein n=1 Tax=Tautonia marina TaxID=2653855 RepID=UPI0012608EC9|nr:hypothetical protein [Tautonia marina]
MTEPLQSSLGFEGATTTHSRLKAPGEIVVRTILGAPGNPGVDPSESGLRRSGGDWDQMEVVPRVAGLRVLSLGNAVEATEMGNRPVDRGGRESGPLGRSGRSDEADFPE